MGKLVQLLNEKMTLMVSLPANNTELFQAAVEGGADAIKIHFNVYHRASGSTFGSLDEYREQLRQWKNDYDGPIGAVIGDSIDKVTIEEMDKLAAEGLDYVSLYSHHAPAWLASYPQTSKMIAFGTDYEPEDLTALRALPIDILEASVLPPEQYGTPLTVHDLIVYRKIVELYGKPVVVPSQRKISTHDLESLKLTGVSAVMIGAIVTGAEPSSLYEVTKQFREKLDAIQ